MVIASAFAFARGCLSLALFQAAGSRSNAGLYVLLGLLVVLAPFWYMAIRQGRGDRQKWMRRSQVLDNGAGTMRHGKLAGRFHGREVALFTSGGGKHGVPYFNAELACSASVSFEIHPHATIVIGKPENAFESGDAGLDGEFGFTSDAPERFKAWLAKPENKQRIAAMLHHGSHPCRLEMKQGRLTWGVRGGLGRDDLDALNAAAVAAAAGNLPSRSVPVDQARQDETDLARMREILEVVNQLAVSLESN